MSVPRTQVIQSGQRVATRVLATFASRHTPGPHVGRSARRRVAKRKALSKRVRFEVFKRDSFKCQYCGKAAPDVVLRVDHIHPVSKGGENELLNLITACVDCNAGKSNVALSDDSAIAKQRIQLEVLNERREQLEMMIAWRDANRDIRSQEFDAALAAIKSAAPGWDGLSEYGSQELRKLIRKFGIGSVLAAIDIAAENYFQVVDGAVTEESYQLGLSRLGGICRLQGMSEDERRLYYIRGIVRKRLDYCVEWVAMELLRDAAHAGAPIDYLETLARDARTWSVWQRWMREVIEEQTSGDGNGPISQPEA